MSEIKVNKISPKQLCTQLTLGDSGDTIIIPSGATITNNGTATGFGRTGTVDWDTTVKTTTVTAVSGVGYFVNTTSGAVTVNLPAGVAGAIVAVSDYANTAATNNITISPNGTDKINGTNQPTKITTNGASATLLYVDSTRGWKDINDATLDVTGVNPFLVATGGTITTSGDYKIHTFTGPGTFTVTSAGTPAGSTTVDYLVVAGGGSGARGTGGGGGAGGFRQSYPNPATAGFPVTVTSYPITVGGGGASKTPATPLTGGESGSPSIFSTITSAGGGGGGNNPCTPGQSAYTGGSGGGNSYTPSTTVSSTGAAGNTPPVSPPQGNPGGGGINGPTGSSGGGGGASAAGGISSNVEISTPGGAGTATSISGSSLTYAGGGGGGQYGTSGTAGNGGAGGGGGGSVGTGGTSGTGGSPGGGNGTPNGPGGNGGTNTGGGGGGGGYATNPTGLSLNSGAGGSGIVVIRYKYQ